MEGIQGRLFIDQQDEVPVGFCPECGGALYRPSRVCIRCERGRP